MEETTLSEPQPVDTDSPKRYPHLCPDPGFSTAQPAETTPETQKMASFRKTTPMPPEALLGQSQALALVSGRCSAAQAALVARFCASPPEIQAYTASEPYGLPYVEGYSLMRSSYRLVALICFAGTLPAQAPTGEIAGTVYDVTRGALANTVLTVTSASTGYSRTLPSNQNGSFSVPSLIPGNYELRAEASGFRTLVQEVIVKTGEIARVDLILQLGERRDAVNVESATPQLEHESYTVDQIVTKEQIQQLPLNGRSFLQLAFLQPGIVVSSSNAGQFNRVFDVAVLGADPDRTRITVDGARINDPVDGGTQQNFSQEIVQEFQVSSVNFDLSTGIAAGGAINVVTRTGSNQLHGSGFFFFRDHHMAAYPALQRDPLAPDPFFARRQAGGWLGGPVVRNRLFFFGSYEHNNQRGVFSALPADPAFRSLATVTPSPFHEDLLNARIDYRVSARHTSFVRYSHDGNDSFAPREANSLPSAWVGNTNYADSGVLSLVSVIRPTVVNEFRYSMTYWSNQNAIPTQDQCPGCLGLGGPHVTVEGAGLIFGNQTNSPQSRLVRRHLFADNLTTQRGSHRMKFGGEWEYLKGTGTYVLDAPADITLFSPEEVRSLAPQLGPSLSPSFDSLDTVLTLPLKSFAFGIGDINQPPAFQRGHADHDNLLHVYWQDIWKLRPRFTLNWGLAWSFETNALNHDLTKPQFLSPIFGQEGLGPERHAWLHFTPAMGFAWSSLDGKTVVRGGAGIYYDTLNIENRLVERAYLGPLGTGYLPLPGSVVPNPFPFISSIPQGTPLDFRTPTIFSGTLLNLLLPLIRSAAIQQLHVNPDNTDLSIRNIDIFKTGTDLFTRDFVPSSAQHFSLGLQRKVTTNLIVTADLVYRHFLHERLRGIDLNHFHAVGGPLIPACPDADKTVPGVECSNGPIESSISGARSSYKGLLVRAEKRLSRRVEAQVSYALQDQAGLYGMYDLHTPVFNLNNWFQNTGPALSRHVLNVSGALDLPGRVGVSFISSFSSRAPFQPIVSGVDFYGTGIDRFTLPGSGTNQFNFGLGRSDLVRLLTTYNQAYAGKPGPNRTQIFPRLTLPQSFDFGRSFDSQDVRVTKSIRVRERKQCQIFVEVFNLFNFANLTGYANDLVGPGFGQPTSRTRNIFGTGGARAFQLGTRLSF